MPLTTISASTRVDRALAADVIEATGAAITSSPAKANILPFMDFM
jgi:hypothetical protein